MGLFTFLIAVLAPIIVRGVVSLFTAGGRADDAQARKEQQLIHQGVAEESAGLAKGEAQTTKTQTIADIGEIRTEGTRFLKTQRAALGFSGVDIHQGSALDIRNRSVTKIGADVQRRQTQGTTDYDALMQDYANYTAAAAAAGIAAGAEDTSYWGNFLSGL